ncbi:hypothetical protein K413DRAFT_4835 [Clostridium sp. ASBs410]|nr:hypothetical protein K413DRAFT_4835 [Clostridium sp. ASBs410]
MHSYNFNENKEYKQYKNVGSKKGLHNYIKWEDSVLQKYKNITDPRFIKNFKAYIKRKCTRTENRRDVLLQLIIPFVVLMISFALAFPSVYIGLSQEQDGILGDLDNTYFDNMVTNKATIHELAPAQVKLYKERIELHDKVAKLALYNVYLVYFLIIICGVVYWILFRKMMSKINFYKDYYEILNNINGRDKD